MRTKTDLIVIHRAEVGFDAYHFIVMRDGTVRPQIAHYLRGRHALQYNGNTVAIALQGCFARAIRARLHTPTDAQYEATRALIQQLRWWYGHIPVAGHTELGSRGTSDKSKLSFDPDNSCPGLRCDLSRLR